MGKSSPSAPAAPDPKATGAAQTATNIGTAIANANMGNVNQVTPDGSLIYSQSGTYKYTDPNDGKSYDIPQYTATQTLSPEQQAIKDQTLGAQLNLGTLANDQSGFLQDYMKQPVDLSAANLDKYTNTHFSDDFNRQWTQQQKDYEQSLADRGVKMGSDAYTRAISDFSTNKANAYDNLLGSQQGQASQSIMAERNQPINEITALLSGSQVSNPNFVNANTSSIPTTDIAGLTQQNYQNQLGIYNSQLAQQNSMMGGLFGLGGSLGSAAILASDVRLKKDISRVGEVNGMGLYLFRYIDEPDDVQRRLGLMAQEVAEIVPDAVVTRPDGFMAVDYAKALGGVH